LLSRKESQASLAQIDEFKEVFRHFDKNNNTTLDRIEFKAALSALGVPFKDEAAVAKVFAEVSENSDKVTLDQYIRYNIQLMEDKDSPDQLKASFVLLADNANSITAAQLNTHPLTEADVAFLQSKLPQNEQGNYDYNAYIGSSFAAQ